MSGNCLLRMEHSSLRMVSWTRKTLLVVGILFNVCNAFQSGPPSRLFATSPIICRSACLTRLRGNARDAADSVARQAEEAMKLAREAEERAATLKRDLMATKAQTQTFGQQKASLTSSTPKTEKIELIDEETLANEMSQMLSGLQKRGSGGKADPLSGTKWALDLDFGREPGTWMDARWGASGQRVRRGLAIQLLPGGQVMPINHSFGLLNTLKGVKGGTWNIEGQFPMEKLKFHVDHDGFTCEESGCDIDLPPGRLFLSANAMGGTLGKKGGMSIEQRRLIVRLERRIVGVFGHSKIE